MTQPRVVCLYIELKHGEPALDLAKARCITIQKGGTSPLTLIIGAFLYPEVEALTSRCFMDP